MTKRPFIGLSLDSEGPGGFANFPWYALRQNYFASVVAAGGLPVALPHEEALVEVYLDRLDGLVVTGGAFDVDPALYGAAETHPKVTLKEARTGFEHAVTTGALERDLPVLGICGGQQLLNVVLGGTLIQHIPDELPDALQHEQENPRDEAGHTVAITRGTLLHDICKTDELSVNSAHHQAAKETGAGVAVNALAPDGVIEGIEDARYGFCLGVQWHPEFTISAGDARIMEAFVAASR
ncbi:MAG: gamma-glutamyl-gamma-aminobutyrate hydrolase family protein [Alphaproteobacteria bacterium]|nr:gamma-glutamyl-gamma-aminobutyrate hydrolase family protein [Alphaproteobacteria bacterium]